jgi:DNA-binding response OmpR family regulator
MATSTIVVARADLTIPGALEPCPGESDPAQIENHFFKTLDQHKADAVVLDLTGPHGQGLTAIRRIRQRSAVPIVVICSPEDKSMTAYREAGAAACMSPPIDPMQLKKALEPSDRRNGSELSAGAMTSAADTLSFSGFVLRAAAQRLIGPDGAELALSAMESRVLLSNRHPWGGLARPGDCRRGRSWRGGDADRAIGPVIARLRKKLGMLAGPAG